MAGSWSVIGIYLSDGGRWNDQDAIVYKLGRLPVVYSLILV